MINAALLRPIRCDIFCVVVDNYGDAGVCWRLAHQLAVEYGWQVRLWIDNPAPLQWLAPVQARGAADGQVEVCAWPADFPVTAPAEVVIEAFACALPATYIDAMARCGEKPVWLNLEYLSAEAWVAGVHGMSSPHPRLPLVKHFFVPGFDEHSGGLLRERDYATRRRSFDAAALRAELGLPPKAPDELTISLFSYPSAPVAQLMQALAQERRPIRLVQPGSDDAACTQGALSTHPLPFLSQPRYDELLCACDVNFVRGEDSFVRAQWAGKPFVWQIYPQADDAHRAKLDAFLMRYTQKAGAGNTALTAFWHAWNGEGTLDWPAFAAALPALTEAAHLWSTALANRPDLASTLVQFCLERLK